jgi:hypothetical protein
VILKASSCVSTIGCMANVYIVLAGVQATYGNGDLPILVRGTIVKRNLKT